MWCQPSQGGSAVLLVKTQLVDPSRVRSDLVVSAVCQPSARGVAAAVGGLVERRTSRRHDTPERGKLMPSNDLTRLASEILQLESETFEVSDYAETNDLFLASSTCSSTTSTTSCSA
jgi:hypothetical protein